MGTCCAQATNPNAKDKTIFTGSQSEIGTAASRDQKQMQDALDQLQEDAQYRNNKQDDQVETSSQPSYLNIATLGNQSNIHSLIQNHGTIEFDDMNRLRKEPFYGAEALNFVMDMNLSSIAKEEVSALQAEKLGIEVQEQIKLTLSHSMDIIELERRKSEIFEVKQETLSVMNPEEKDEMIRRTSSQFEQQQSILKQQQQQLLQNQQLLEKQQQIIIQQKVQQHQQQQIAAVIKQQVFSKQGTDNLGKQATLNNALDKTPIVILPPPQEPQKNPPNIIIQHQQVVIQQQNQSVSQIKSGGGGGGGIVASAPSATLTKTQSNQSPAARGRLATDNESNASVDSVQTDKPRSIMKRRGNSSHSNSNGRNTDLNGSFDSDVNSQKSSAKKKVKFKDSTFKKTTKKKKY